MNANDETPAQELFLVIEELSEQLDSLLLRLRTLSQAPETGLLIGVDALYRADKDLALLCLRFNKSLGAPERRELIRLACKGGVPVLDPLRLSAGDKDLFYQRHLRRYAVRIDDKNSPNSAIDALGQLLGLIELRARSESDALPSSQGSATRLDTNRPFHDEYDGPPQRNTALGSESDADQPMAEFCAESTLELVKPLDAKPPEAKPADLNLIGMALGPAGKPSLIHKPAKGKPAANRRVSTRLATIPAKRASVAAPSSRSSAPRAAVGRRLGSSPGTNKSLGIRFARGDQWFAARPRNLSLRQIRLAASAAPPLTAAVQVEVTLDELTVCVPGIVVEVINTESSDDGSTSFRVELGKLDRFQLEALATILREAQARGVALSPPPARKNRRFAVTWPIAVACDGKRFSGAALDVSAQGLFIATTDLIVARQVSFGIPLDTDEPNVEGRARIAREVTEAMAAQRQLKRGYGLQFERLESSDRGRYEQFLVRVKERSQRHVVVGGSSSNAGALADSLQSAGYAVSRVGTAARLKNAATWTNGRPDIAVLALEDDAAPMEAGFRARGIPVFRTVEQSATRAREALDQHLSV